jgi:hypothetical protein
MPTLGRTLDLRRSHPRRLASFLRFVAILPLDTRSDGSLQIRVYEVSDDPGVCCTAISPRTSACTVRGLRHGPGRRSRAVLLPYLLGQHSTVARAILPVLRTSLHVA